MPGNDAVQWSKECECTGQGNGGNGCGAILVVEWSDLFLTCMGGDPRDRISAPRQPRPGTYLADQATQIFTNPPPTPFGDAISITFRCHDCQVETDILTIPLSEISRIFYQIPTKREWDQKAQKFSKD